MRNTLRLRIGSYSKHMIHIRYAIYNTMLTKPTKSYHTQIKTNPSLYNVISSNLLQCLLHDYHICLKKLTTLFDKHHPVFTKVYFISLMLTFYIYAHDSPNFTCHLCHLAQLWLSIIYGIHNFIQ